METPTVISKKMTSSRRTVLAHNEMTISDISDRFDQVLKVKKSAIFSFVVPLDNVLKRDGTFGQSSVKLVLEFQPLQFRAPRGGQAPPNVGQLFQNANHDANSVLLGFMEMQRQAQANKGPGPVPRKGGHPELRDGFDLFLKMTSFYGQEILTELVLTDLGIKCSESLENPDNDAGSASLQADIQIKQMPKLIPSANQPVHLYRIECCQGKHGDILKVELDAEFEYEAAEMSPRNNVVRTGTVSSTNEGLTGIMSSLQAAKDCPDLHDFELLCDGKSFPCSKFMLKARSDVFKAMLSHPETRESKMKKVVIEDCTPEALGIFLQLMYTGQADIPEHCLSLLFNLADRYQVHSIKHTVSNQLQDSVCIDNACQFAILAHLHGEDRLLNTALQMMKQGLAQVKEMSVWKEIENKYPIIMTKLLMLDLNK